MILSSMSSYSKTTFYDFAFFALKACICRCYIFSLFISCDFWLPASIERGSCKLHWSYLTQEEGEFLKRDRCFKRAQLDSVYQACS